MSQSPNNRQPDINNEEPQYILNIDPAHENPKELLDYVEKIEDYEEEIKEQIDQMISNELEKEVMDEMQKIRFIENDDDSEDKDKWFPDYKNCKCCQGFVYNCTGNVCISMGQCYCKMKDDIEEELEKNGENVNANSDNSKSDELTN